ncbi:MAG: class I SAM-dependent methyltransferase, partial [bacterium]
MNAFDNPPEKDSLKASAQQKAALRLIGSLKIGAQDTVINIACGPGDITNLLAKATNGKVTGIDVSESMIEHARSLYPQIEFKQLATENLAYNNEFDIAFCNSPFLWVGDPDKAIKAIHRTLKNSGKFGL